MRVNVNHFPAELQAAIGPEFLMPGIRNGNRLGVRRKRFAKTDIILQRFGRKALVESVQCPGYIYVVTQCDRWNYEESQ